MESRDDEPTLGDDDSLSLWVGRVARSHAHLEYTVDNIHRLLVQQVGRVPDGKSVKGFDQIATECRSLLRRSDADPEIMTAGDIALRAAQQVTGIRNRVVHDMWLPDALREDWEPPRWNAFRRSGDLDESYSSSSSHDLTTVIEAHTTLRRTRMRVSGLFMALHAIWRSDRTPNERAPQVARYVALMTDRFTLHANGDFDVT